MKISTRHLARGLIAAAALGLSACGGGGGSAADKAPASLVQGVAATGHAIDNGLVTLRCSVGATPGVGTQTDGRFSIDVSRVTLPCVARVEYVDKATSTPQRLHSLVRAPGHINITPVTDLVVAHLSAGGVAADVYDRFDAAAVNAYSDDRIRTATEMVKSQLASLGVDTTPLPDDVIGSRLVAASASSQGDRHDGVLDDIGDKLREHHKNLGDVEHDMREGHETRGLSTSTGQPGDAAAGKLAYEANCQACHGARIPDAVNSAKTMEAIRENEGGMGRLGDTVGLAMADDIATYLANGVGGGPGTALLTQSITFASPGNQTMGVATPTLVATATSGLPVAIASSTPAVCTVSKVRLTLVAPGTCSLSASQGGNAAYGAAATVTRTFTVAARTGVVLLKQSISFTSPGPQVVGTPAALTASAESGLAVRFASTTPAVCTVSGSTLTPVAAGNCTVTADQGGDSVYAAAATVTRTVAVTDPAAVPSAANGKLLYARCSGCHGPAVDNRFNVLAGANSPATIRAAINRNLGGMGSLSGLGDPELADIAAYLATPTL